MQLESSSSASFCSVSPLAKILTAVPVMIPVINAVIILIMANTPPRSEYVIKMLSTPVCGVDVRNDIVLPFPAPLSLSDAATGNTLHEQSGRGTPKRDALQICQKFDLPRCFLIRSGVMNADKTPAMKSPSNSAGAIIAVNSQKEIAILIISFIC